MLADDYVTVINDSRIFTIVLASISVLFPLSVVFILIQRYNTLVRGKSLVHYILVIAIADTMTSIFYAFGYPSSGSVACSIQGFCKNYFARMSWFFTDVLILQLFYVVVFKSYFFDKRYMHAIVFTLNMILSLIPLSTGASYGLDDDDKGIPIGFCGFYGKDKSQWSNYTFNIEALISLMIIIILTMVIIVYSLKFNNKTSSNIYINERIKDSWKIVILYPLSMCIAWIPSVAYGYYFNAYIYNNSGKYPPNGHLIFDYLAGINVLYGPLLSIIFYTKTMDARKAWIDNLKYILNLIKKIDDTDDDRITCDSILSIDDFRMSEIELNSSSNYKSNRSTLTTMTSIASISWNNNNNNQGISINNTEQLNPMSHLKRISITEV